MKFSNNKGNNYTIQQNKNKQNDTMNIENYCIIDSYENIKNIKSILPRDKNNFILSFNENGKFHQDSYNINDFINLYTFISIENKEYDSSINLLFPNNKINGSNDIKWN